MKKLSEEKKAILIYSGELVLFAIIFCILGILKITKVMGYNQTRRIIFNWITLFGGCWGIADFIWAMCSKTRQKRISIVDKIVVLPLSIYIIVFDFVSLINKPENDNFYIYMLGAAFLYVSVIYTFEAIYHYYKPIPGLFDDDEKESAQIEPNITDNADNSTK